MVSVTHYVRPIKMLLSWLYPAGWNRSLGILISSILILSLNYPSTLAENSSKSGAPSPLSAVPSSMTLPLIRRTAQAGYSLSSSQVGDRRTGTETNASRLRSTKRNSDGRMTSSAVGTTFTPLHLYFISTTGNDSNSGTSLDQAWATPNHPVNCGDVIIVDHGLYTTQFNQGWGTVSNCPSTSGGVDGNGGIYFATVLCAGPDLESCQVKPGPNAIAFDIQERNNWAVEGFKATSGGVNTSNAVTPAYAADFCTNYPTWSCPTGAAYHHLAFINNIAYDSSDGFSPAGSAGQNSGIDYLAFIGNIAQNSAQGNPNPAYQYCVSAIDVVAPKNYDKSPGTHIYVYGNFSYDNQTDCATDVENYMFDTWDEWGYASQGVAQNNMGWLSGRPGFQITAQGHSASDATVFLLNNTLYGSNQSTAAQQGYANGDINVQGPQGGTAIWGGLTIQKNLVEENVALLGGLSSCPSNSRGCMVYPFVLGGDYQNVTVGGSGYENYFSGMLHDCNAPVCLPTWSSTVLTGAATWGTVADLGTNFYTSPAFNNPSDLVNYRKGTPYCYGFTNTTACMGYDANTQTLTNPSAIYDLQPTVNEARSAGYQLPSTACVTDGSVATYYPVWLKGIVYLQWDSSTQTITENADLVTKPCGL